MHAVINLIKSKYNHRRLRPIIKPARNKEQRVTKRVSLIIKEVMEPPSPCRKNIILSPVSKPSGSGPNQRKQRQIQIKNQTPVAQLGPKFFASKSVLHLPPIRNFKVFP